MKIDKLGFLGIFLVSVAVMSAPAEKAGSNRDMIPFAEALDNAAKAWEKITEDMGREKQLSLYRGSLGLPLK